MCPVEFDCNLPSPYLSMWRPSACNSSNAIMQALESLAIYLCENIIEGVGNNNLRVVPGGTGEGDFNAEFDAGLPADNSIVLEGDNIWYTADAGVNWDILHTNSFQGANGSEFADPANPLAIELRALFPNSETPQDALVYNFYDNSFYWTKNSGVAWLKADYVDITGDTMTGTLNITVDETDSTLDPLPIYGLNASVTHTITAANDAEPIGVNSEAILNSDIFTVAEGPVGLKAFASSVTGAAGSVTVAKAIQARVLHGGAGVLTDGIGVDIDSLIDSGPGSVTNYYGLKVGNVTNATNNYAIHTGLGLNRFGDSVNIVGQNDAVQLLVTGDSGQASPLVEVDKFGGNDVFYILADGEINILPASTVGDGGGSSLYLVTPSRTAMTASAEQVAVYLDVSSNREWSAGAIANQREILIERPTYSFTSASTITNAATFYIAHAPAPGANATITNAYALWVDDGTVRLDGTLDHNGSLVGFYGVAPVAQSAAYTISNVTPDRSYDANATSLDEIADTLGTLIADLQLLGLIG